MSQDNKAFSIVRATSTVRKVAGKKDKTKTWGFQTLGLLTGEGMFSQFEHIFDADTASHFLPPGDYEVHPDAAYVDKSGNLQMGKQFVLVAKAKAA